MQSEESFGDAPLERYITGDRSAEAIQAFQSLSLTNPAFAERIALLSDESVARASNSWNSDREWLSLQARIRHADAGSPETSTVSPRRATVPNGMSSQAPTRSPSGLGGKTTRWAVLAVAALAVIGYGIKVRRFPSIPDLTRTVTTGRGEQLSVTLLDSSSILLGPVSTLTYHVNRDVRDIQLSGIARFRVTHDVKRPFVVHAGTTQITDAGTEFVVRAYGDEPRISVSVASGRVALALAAAADRDVALSPGDVATVSAGTINLSHETDISRFDAWGTGRLIFENMPLDQVGRELGHWFDVKFVFADSELARRPVNAVYTRATLQDILTGLSATLGVQVDQVGQQVTVSRNKP